LIRAWALLAGLPVGGLAAFSLAGATGLALAAGMAAGGLLLLAAVHGIARAGDDDPARAAHLAAAAGVGWAALPALGAGLLGLAPPPVWWLAFVVAALAVALRRAALRQGPCGGVPRQLLGVARGLVGGGVAVAALALFLAARQEEPPTYDADRAAAIFDRDAAVVTRPIPRCKPAPASQRVLRDTGARPRVDPEGRYLWYDADVEGRRQVQRMDLASGESVCWTCGEDGNNLAPSPGGHATGVAFVTDRHATLTAPANTELHLARGRGDAPRWPSRRITYSAAIDHAPVLARDAGIVIWSRHDAGSYEVVTAALRSAHGGLGLGPTTRLAAGGAAWTAPLAWSPDGRSLVVARGNPLAPVPVRGIDFATGRVVSLGERVAGFRAAAFNGDGGWLVLAATRPLGVIARLPAWTGALIGPLAQALGPARPGYRHTEVRVGEPWGPGAALELGDVAEWGAPTGVTLLPDGTSIVLGQRAPDGAERLLELTLDCLH
jgi:hypothetical protein